MKLSIIIPVYNAQKYLQKCLNSIVAQGLDESFEVILINDGSSDRSLEIAESYKDRIVNYHISSHVNQGEAVSRNMALSIAKGRYITFLDSDDYYEGAALASALELVERDNLEILYLRLRQVDEEGNFLGFAYDLHNEETVSRGLNYERRPFPATIYKRTIIGDIRFPLNILVGPDSVFNALVQSRAERVCFTKKAVYNYTHRIGSLGKQGKTKEAFSGFVLAIKEIRNFQRKHFNENIESKSYFDNLYEVFVTRITELHIMPTWNEQKYKELVTLLKKQDLLYILDNFAAKYRYFDHSFTCFMLHHRYLELKSKIYSIIYRV